MVENKLFHVPLTNKILSRINDRDLDLLNPHLDYVELPARFIIEHRRRPIRDVFFIDTGIASVVTSGASEVEVGMVGYEGMTGISVLLEAESPLTNQTYMQIAGSGRRISANNLRSSMAQSSSLRKALISYANQFIQQISQTAMANAKGTLDQRLARWILMAQDRLCSERLPLTHEFLAVMLGARRAGVTVAIGELGRMGIIEQDRGGFTILDRQALERLAGAIYTPLLFEDVDQSLGQ